MRKVIGLTGKLGAGKDTVASFFVEFGWRRIAFSDALYEEISKAFGVPVSFLQNRATKETALTKMALAHCRNEEFIRAALPELNKEDALAGIASDVNVRLQAPRSPRRILQLWGTEYRRKRYSDDYWRSIVSKAIGDNRETDFVVTDVRFPDEAVALKTLGAQLVRVVRTSQKGETIEDARTQHASETSLDGYPADNLLLNKEGADGLANLRCEVLKEFVF